MGFWTWITRRSPAREGYGDLLSGLPPFETLSRGELRRVEGAMRLLACEPGTTIFREGDPDDRFYVILEGRVEMRHRGPGGDPVSLAFLERGDFLGETALVSDMPRTASAVACGDARLLTFSRADFTDLCDRFPHLGVQLVLGLSQVIAERMRQTNRLLKEAQAGPVRPEESEVPEESEIERHRSGETT